MQRQKDIFLMLNFGGVSPDNAMHNDWQVNAKKFDEIRPSTTLQKNTFPRSNKHSVDEINYWQRLL